MDREHVLSLLRMQNVEDQLMLDWIAQLKDEGVGSLSKLDEALAILGASGKSVLQALEKYNAEACSAL